MTNNGWTANATLVASRVTAGKKNYRLYKRTWREVAEKRVLESVVKFTQDKQNLKKKRTVRKS